MITSGRKFGVEVEFVAPSRTNLLKIAKRIPVTEDGSLRPLENAGEYVSPPLKGAKGEQAILDACSILKDFGAQSTDIKTSVHVHLDGLKNVGVFRSAKSSPNLVGKKVVAVSNRLKERVDIEDIKRYLDGEYMLQSVAEKYKCQLTKFGGVWYLSLAELKRRPLINYTFYWYEKQDRFNWLRNVLYFYTKFSQTMEDMVSKSRKFGNMYCIPLASSYNLSDIENCSNIEELSSVWYKNRPKGNHYDDSRYHNVNLHSYWDRHGTVEIRSHGGTIDPYKILMWVKLHQLIADKLEDMTIEELKSLGNTHKDFIEFLNDDLLADYVKRLIGYYSGVKI